MQTGAPALQTGAPAQCANIAEGHVSGDALLEAGAMMIRLVAPATIHHDDQVAVVAD